MTAFSLQISLQKLLKNIADLPKNIADSMPNFADKQIRKPLKAKEKTLQPL